MNRRQFLRWSAAATATAAFGVGGYTWQVEPHWVEVVERELPVDGLPPELAGARRPLALDRARSLARWS